MTTPTPTKPCWLDRLISAYQADREAKTGVRPTREEARLFVERAQAHGLVPWRDPEEPKP